VIEQAKGLLVERHGITLDEAFDRLRKLSQEHNVRLVEVAATLVASALPPGAADAPELRIPTPIDGTTPETSTTWRALRGEAGLQVRTSTAVFHAMSSATGDSREAGELLRAICAPLGVEAVVLYRFAVAGALRLVAWHGYPEDMMRAWEAIPPGIEIPVMAAAVQRRTIALPSLAERSRLYPALRGMRVGSEATVCVPIVDAGHVTGSILFGWREPRDLDEETIRTVEHLAAAVGPVLVRQAELLDRDLMWLHTVLATLFDPWLLLEPVPGADDQPMDFEVVGAGGPFPDSASLLGRRLLELWPGLAASDIFKRLLDVEASGWPWEAVLAAGDTGGLPLCASATRVRIVRVGTRAVLHWRHEPDSRPPT
jgi:hypothetical protein